MRTYPLPQPLTGTEIVTIQQQQNGQWFECSMPLSELLCLFGPTSWASTLPTSKPSASGVLWNNSGVVSIS